MLDGKAYLAHFPDDPAYDLSDGVGGSGQLKSAALMDALAALESEFRTILRQSEASPEPFFSNLPIALRWFRPALARRRASETGHTRRRPQTPPRRLPRRKRLRPEAHRFSTKPSPNVKITISSTVSMLMFARPHVSQRCCNRATSEHKISVPICPGEKISAALQNSHSYDGSGLICPRGSKS